jgi:hypothetical protein
MAVEKVKLTKAVVKETFEIELLNKTMHKFEIGDVLDIIQFSQDKSDALLMVEEYPYIMFNLPLKYFSTTSDAKLDVVLKRAHNLRLKEEARTFKEKEKEEKIRLKEQKKKSGRTYIKNKRFYKMNIQEFADKINWLMYDMGVTKEDIHNKLGIDFATQSLWLNASSFPSPEVRKQLSEMFNVPESFLEIASTEKAKAKVIRSKRGSSDWYFKHMNEVFDVVNRTDEYITVAVAEDEAVTNKNISKGDYIIIF